MKKPPKSRGSTGSQTKEQILAASVIAHTPYDSPLIDALMDGEIVHQLLNDAPRKVRR